MAGLSFAYQVGLLITAHVSKGPFPYFHNLMLLSLIGALDANAKKFGLSSFFHENDGKALVFVYTCLLASFLVYAFFVMDTVNTFCRVLDINCLSIK